ncbi:hypothetical protein ACWD4L_26860 [Streptomyces sp. NPDC002596]
MQHLALWDATAPDDDRPETTWLEHVTDAQYQAPAPATATDPVRTRRSTRS